MTTCTDQNQGQDCKTRNDAYHAQENNPLDKGRRSVLRKFAVGAVAVAGCSIVPDEWMTPLVEFTVLPAHAATSGVTADPPYTQTEVIEKSGMISIDKILRPKFVSPKLGTDFGSSMKIVFDTGPVINVPNTAYDVITKEEQVYRVGGLRPEIPTMEVYAEPGSDASKITIHYMG